jgi:hypothetical protein
MIEFFHIIHYRMPYFKITFRRLDFCLRPQVKSPLSWAQSTELGPIAGHQNQLKTGYVEGSANKQN